MGSRTSGKPKANRTDDAAGPGVGHDNVAMRQESLLPYEAIDAHVGGLMAQLGRVDLATHGDDDVRVQLAQPCHHAREQVARLLMEHRAESEVHGRPAGSLMQPVEHQGA